MASGVLGRPGFALLGAYSPLERADRPLAGAAGFGLFGAWGRFIGAIWWGQSQVSWPPVWSISGHAIWAVG